MNSFIDFLGLVNDLAGFVSLIVAVMVWLKLKALDRLNEEISVTLVLEGGKKEVSLPLVMTRKDITRAELLGRLGMLPMVEKGKRFSIRHLSTPEFFRSLNDVAANKTDILTIPCSEEEINQFDL